MSNHIEHLGIHHDEMVKALMKTPEAILAELTLGKVAIWNSSSCIMGEAGELFDAVKKYVFYNKTLDLQNVIEELGDLEFYLEDLRRRLGIERDETLRANIEKLSVRYRTMQYSDAAAQGRADKANPQEESVR